MSEPLSPRNQLVQHARLLARDRKERSAGGLAVLEGVRLAEDALAAGVRIEYVLFTEELAGRERGAALLQGLQLSGVACHLCSPAALERAADTESPQGVVAVFRPHPWRLEQIGPGLALVLDNLQDPGNLGTVIRSLEALGGAGAVVAGGVDPLNPKVVRSAMGSLFRLPVVTSDMEAALRHFRAQGRPIYVADAKGPLAPWQANLDAGAVLIIGNEGAGPSDLSRRLADGVISIPMEGRAESLNASVAASLLIYEALRQRRLAVPSS